MKNSKESKEKKKYPGKGQIGYLKFKKSVSLALIIGLLLIAACIFVLGLALNEWKKGNIFTVVAILFVLPMARALTYYILLFPYKDVKQEDYDEVIKAAKSGSVVYCNSVITSTERAMGFDYIVITANKVIAFLNNKKCDVNKVNDYLSDFIKRKGFDQKVTVTNDNTRFFSLLKASDSSDRTVFNNDAEYDAFVKERERLMENLESIMA